MTDWLSDWWTSSGWILYRVNILRFGYLHIVLSGYPSSISSYLKSHRGRLIPLVAVSWLPIHQIALLFWRRGSEERSRYKVDIELITFCELTEMILRNLFTIGKMGVIVIINNLNRNLRVRYKKNQLLN